MPQHKVNLHVLWVSCLLSIAALQVHAERPDTEVLDILVGEASQTTIENEEVKPSAPSAHDPSLSLDQEANAELNIDAVMNRLQNQLGQSIAPGLGQTKSSAIPLTIPLADSIANVVEQAVEENILWEDDETLIEDLAKVAKQTQIDSEAEEVAETVDAASCDAEHVAAYVLEDNAAAFQACLDQGYEVASSLAESQATVLHLAAKAGQLTMVKALIEKKAPINALDAKKRTPLFYAVLGKQPDMVKYLLSQGADASLRDKYGTDAKGRATSSSMRKLFN